jgi:multimeric flavodoxin WrbA
MNILFINSSPNKNGNTAGLAKVLLKNCDYKTLDLCNYRINFYGQTLPGDQFGEVVEEMKRFDTVVIGSPLYWHNVSGALRTLLDHFYGEVSEGAFSGKNLFFLYQGAAPEKWMLEAGEFTMKRFCALYGFTYQGMATNRQEAEMLSSSI